MTAAQAHAAANKERYRLLARKRYLRSVGAEPGYLAALDKKIAAAPLIPCAKCGQPWRLHLGIGKRICDV